MAQVISFDRYRPIARYDEIPWTDVRVEEGESVDGPWTVLETIAVEFGPNPPVDPDPSEPAVRSFTTELADDAMGLWYRLVFVDDTGDTEAPTAARRNGDPSNLYVTADELKELLALQNETFADAAVDIAVESASRTCDAYKDKTGVGFYATTATRYYTPDRYADDAPIDDLVSASSVTVDQDGDGTYEETWVEGTDFFFNPVNAAANGVPYKRIRLLRQAGRRFPAYDNGLKITGSFGWAATPVQVKQAAILIANHLLFRTREAPLGVLVAAGADAVAMARLGRLDTAAALLLDQVDPEPSFRSLQLN